MRLKHIALVLVVILSFAISLWYLGLNGLFAAIPSSLLVFVLTNLEWVGSLIASSYKVGRKVNFWFEKNAVEKRLEITIDSTSKRINEEGVSLLPHGVDIKWVKPMERDAFLKEGKIIVCLESSYNEARNLARAAVLYVAEDLIRESQRFISPQVARSMTFILAKKMLMLDKRFDALKCLNEEFVEPDATKTPKIREYVSLMENMEEKGFFTRILLREFSYLDLKLSPALSDANAINETESFTKFLGVFVEREAEENVPLIHNRRVIKVNLMPVARTAVKFDISRYVKRALTCYDKGVDTIYVLAWGLNIVLAESVVKAIEQTSLYITHQKWVFLSSGSGGRFRTHIAVLTRIER
jgi:hypothetical protein